MIVPTNLLRHCSIIHAATEKWWSFTSLYLDLWIWSRAISDSWSEATAYQSLRATSPGRLRRCGLLVEEYHWWWELDLPLRLRQNNILPSGYSKLNVIEKGNTVGERKQECALCSRIIRSGRPKSTSRTAVTLYGDCAKMCEDFTQNFGEEKTGCCMTKKHHLTLSFSPGNFDRKQHDCRPQTTHPTFMTCPLATFFLFFLLKMQPFWSNLCDRGRNAGGAQQPHKTRILGYVWEMSEALGTFRTSGRGLHRGWAWVEGPKLVFEGRAIPVLEIMDYRYTFLFSFHTS